MLGFGKTSTARAEAGSDRSQDADIYDRFGVGLYRQALLTLRDAALAEHLVCDVIVDECALSPPPGRGEADARHRLAESAFRRCQRLAAEHDRSPGRPPGAGVADCIDPGGLPSGTEREHGRAVHQPRSSGGRQSRPAASRAVGHQVPGRSRGPGEGRR